MDYGEDRVSTGPPFVEGFATKRYGWLVSGQVIKDRRLGLVEVRRGDGRRFDMIDFSCGLVWSSDPICDVLVKNLPTNARSTVIAKTTIELFERGIRVVGRRGPHETVSLVGIAGE